MLQRYRARCAELKAEGQVHALTGPKQLPCFWLSVAQPPRLPLLQALLPDCVLVGSPCLDTLLSQLIAPSDVLQPHLAPAQKGMPQASVTSLSLMKQGWRHTIPAPEETC